MRLRSATPLRTAAGAALAALMVFGAGSAGATSLAGVSTGSPGTRPGAVGPASVLGLRLSGVGTTFTPPSAPSSEPYSPDCRSVIDPGFSGTCVVAAGPSGTTMGVVEMETSAGAQAVVQERDLVWRRVGPTWRLAERRVGRGRSPHTLLWSDDLATPGQAQLVFATIGAAPRSADELDIVDPNGHITLMRALAGGYAEAASPGRLVTYVPSRRGAFVQTLLRFVGGTWMVESEQSVPASVAQAAQRSAFVTHQPGPAQHT